MNCATTQKALSAYLDRQLLVWEKDRVALHLQTCASCQEELEDLISLKKEMRSCPMPGMPAELRARIESETFRRKVDWRSWWAGTSPFKTSVFRRWWAPAFVLAAGAASWVLLRSSPSHVQSATPPQAAQAPHAKDKVMAWHKEPIASRTDHPN